MLARNTKRRLRRVARAWYLPLYSLTVTVVRIEPRALSMLGNALLPSHNPSPEMSLLELRTRLPEEEVALGSL